MIVWRIIYSVMCVLHCRIFQRTMWWLLRNLKLDRLMNDEDYLKLQMLGCTGERYLMPWEGGGVNSIIVWMRLHWLDKPFVSDCCDKLKVRRYIREKIGEEFLVPMYCGEEGWADPDQIDFDALPKSFVLKSNNGSSMNLLVWDKAKLDVAKTKETLREWMAFNYASNLREHQYEHIENRIMCELMLPVKDGESPDDYKFMCSDGKVLYIWVDRGRYTHHQRTIYNADWIEQDVTYFYPHVKDLPAPKNFEKMKEVARLLSKGIPLVRIDLYNFDGKIYFGEITFTSDGNKGVMEPFSFSQEIASKVQLKRFMT